MSELDFSSLKSCLEELGLALNPVIVHASLKSFGRIQGGAETLLHALMETTAAVVAPTFTYKTMVTPEVGPAHNGIQYGSDANRNAMAQPFHPNMPVDPLIGVLPEALRKHPAAQRTAHPILSFAGINAERALRAQTLYNPLAPIGVLADQDGWVVLLGTNHTANTSIHYGERLAGRRQFTRWALASDRVVECPGFPGDSTGFEAIAGDLSRDTRQVQIGGALVQAVPLSRLFEATRERLSRNPLDLLCERADCGRCSTIRAAAC